MADPSKFEPKRPWRFTLEIEGIQAFRVNSIELIHMGDGPHDGYKLKVLCMAFEDSDLTDCAIPVPGRGKLIFPNEDGETIDAYDLSWTDSRFTPFERLSYDDEGCVLQVIELLNLSMRRT